jgi:hypothetical protein
MIDLIIALKKGRVPPAKPTLEKWLARAGKDRQLKLSAANCGESSILKKNKHTVYARGRIHCAEELP